MANLDQNGMYSQLLDAYFAGGGQPVAGTGEVTTAPKTGPYWWEPNFVEPFSYQYQDGKLQAEAPQDTPYQAPAANPALLDPAQDATFLAFQRALGSTEDTLRADVAARVARLRQSAADQEPNFQKQKTRGMKRIEQDHASRGTYVSSARLDDENELTNDIDSSRTALQRDTANQEADLQGDLARSIALGRQNLVEQEGSARTRLTDKQTATNVLDQSAYNARQGNRRREYLTVLGR